MIHATCRSSGKSFFSTQITNNMAIMMRKTILALLLLISGLTLKAQSTGYWTIHPVFVGDNAHNVIETPNYVYYYVSNNLFRLTKATDENEALSKQNYLNDVAITHIAFNYKRNYLVVTYKSSNVDVLLDDGKVINLPDLAQTTLTLPKDINGVGFGNGKVFIATDFGYVAYDEKKWEVLETRRFSNSQSEDMFAYLPMYSAAEVGDYMILANDYGIYYAPLAETRESLRDYKLHEVALSEPEIVIIDDTHFFVNDSRKGLQRFEIANGQLSSSIVTSHATTLQPTPDGFVINVPQHGYYTTDAMGLNLKHSGEDATGLVSAHPNGDGGWWTVSSEGLSNSEQPENVYRPNATSIPDPFWLTYDERTNKVYVSNTGTVGTFKSAQYDTTAVNVYDGVLWKDITPRKVNGSRTNSTYWVTLDPDSTDSYYLGSWFWGLFKVSDETVSYTYDWKNSALIHALNNYYCHAIPFIDRNKNLWIVQTGNGENPVMVLPNAKRKQVKTTTDDWLTPNITNLSGRKFSRVVAGRHSDVITFAVGDQKLPLVFWTPDPSSPATITKQASYTSVTDQDNNVLEWGYIYALAEDLNGNIWVGYNLGVFSLNPQEAFSNNFKVNHIKVPRNDGSGLADYLLDGIQVNAIAVDAANRKWIGTNTNGVFLVSADGSEIIDNFTTENSMLTSNQIYNIVCNTQENKVYVATSNSFMEYYSIETPANDNMNDVYAYPNPVRPDYYGEITICNLMENTLVKITDSSGNVIKQLKSNGGTARWDGCNDAGDQVKSGVYFIFASNNNNSTANNAVTKILIMR